MDTQEPSDTQPDVLLRAKKAAEILDISVTHFRELVRERRLPRPTHLGRCALWSRDELLRWAKEKP